MTSPPSPSLAYHPSQFIELQALPAADGQAFVVVRPWGKEEELTALTGFHALASRFGKVGETVLLEDDKGKTFLEGGTHDGFLTRGDGRRDEHGTLAGKGEEAVFLCVDLFWGKTARALYLKELRTVKEKAIANGRELLTCDSEASLHAEEIGVLTLHEETARVVAKVVEPSLELPLSKEEFVVEADGEEEAVGGMGVSGLGLLGRLLLS